MKTLEKQEKAYAEVYYLNLGGANGYLTLLLLYPRYNRFNRLQRLSGFYGGLGKYLLVR